jgi:glutamyl-tRNA reductase
VTLLDMDALQRAVRGHLSVRRNEAVHAEAIVEEEIQTFAGWLGRLEVLPTLSALRARGDDVVRVLLAANAGRWETMAAKDEARVEALAKAVVKRILHEPTERVRTLDDEHRHARLKLLRELFGLEEEAASEAGEAAEVRRLAG